MVTDSDWLVDIEKLIEGSRAIHVTLQFLPFVIFFSADCMWLKEMPFIIVSLIFTDFTPLDGLEYEWYTEDTWKLTNVWKKRFLNRTFTALHTLSVKSSVGLLVHNTLRMPCTYSISLACLQSITGSNRPNTPVWPSHMWLKFR